MPACVCTEPCSVEPCSVEHASGVLFLVADAIACSAINLCTVCHEAASFFLLVAPGLTSLLLLLLLPRRFMV